MLRLILSVCLTLFLSFSVSQAQGNGLKTLPASKNAAATIIQLEQAIKARGMKVFTKIDHAAAASEFGLEMPPSTVVIFGNPKGGTPNFLKKPTLAIDLPLKMLVWEDKDGQAFVTYNTAAYVFETLYPRHGRKVPAAVIERLEKRLNLFAKQAAK